MGFESILKSLVQKELILPYLENQIMADKWPESYTITIDSSPYYGHGDGMFHPSSHPLKGERLLYYMFHPDHRDRMIRELPSMRSQMTLAMGSSLHGVLQTQMQMIGLVPPENIEVEYVIPEHNCRGRIDWIFQHPSLGDIIVEMKTRNPYKFKTQDTIEASWDLQLSMAEYALGKNDGVLLMVESGWPYAMKEFRHQRNDAALQATFDKFDYVRLAIEANEPPRHCCGFGSPEMTSCPARFECWLKP